MRIVIDPNVLISAAVATGVSAELVDRWLSERPFEIVACPTLLAELRHVLQRDKFRRWLDHTSVTLYVGRIERESESWPDPSDISPLTGDPKDDYLVALLRETAADLIVSADPDLTSLAIDDVTVLPPGGLLEQL